MEFDNVEQEHHQGVDPSEGHGYVLSDFEEFEMIGEGSYSTVHKCVMKKTGGVCALKAVNKFNIIKYNKVKYMMQEKEILLRLNQLEQSHEKKYIVQLIGTFQDHQNLYFILEWAKHGDLLSYMEKTLIKLNHIKKILAQLIRAVQFLHQNGIIHRDIKPQNILLDENLNIKLSDFGCALNLDEILKSQSPIGLKRSHSFVGSAEYIPPELIQSTPIPIFALPAMDLWAIGVLLYQLLTNSLPFSSFNEYQIYQRILKRDLVYPKDMEPSAIDLINKLTVKDPEERLQSNGYDYTHLSQHEEMILEITKEIISRLKANNSFLNEPLGVVENHVKTSIFYPDLCDILTNELPLDQQYTLSCGPNESTLDMSFIVNTSVEEDLPLLAEKLAKIKGSFKASHNKFDYLQ